MTADTPMLADVPPKPAVSWRSLPSLYLRPRAFFATYDLERGGAWFWVAWLVGLSSAITQIDKNLVRAELGHPRPGWSTFGNLITESWLGFWTLLLFTSSVGAVLIWYIGGWWYRIRLRWSGAERPDPLHARLIYTFAAAVSAIPTVAYVVLAMPFFAGYGDLWAWDSWLPTVLLVFPFWSVWASYSGVRTSFAVRATPARLWFLVLPAIVYLVSLGGLAVLYALLRGDADGSAAA